VTSQPQPPNTKIALDATIHAPIRLQLMAALSVLADTSRGHDFTDLRELTGATDGNLGAHLTTLEKVGYVTISKAFVKRRPKTTIVATALGRSAYAAHVTALRQIIDPSA
jgi:DNA-binding MarR family transcriptional regulator